MTTTFQEKYDLQKTIGHPGSYGKVHSVVCRQTKAQYAVKIMTKPTSTVSKRERMRAVLINNEIAIASTLSHPKIVRFREVIQSGDFVYIVMEKCLGGDLFDRIMQYNGKIPEQVASRIFSNLLGSVDYIHRNGIVHGDIKLSNIMFADDNDDSLRLIDFGMSQPCEKGQFLTEMVGTPNYQSPDVVSGQYSFASDCWSLGVVLFVMIFGFNPFDPFGLTNAIHTVHERVQAGFNPITKTGYGAWFPADMEASNEVKDLIAHLLAYRPETRMTVLQAKNHPWVVAGATLAHRHPQIVSLAPCA